MADNTDEEHLDNSIIPQSENLSEETISTNQTDTIIPKHETENMEVHKHPHLVTHKKKWGEYLLEFLMLFLAVFLGFIAENIREGSVERRREKEYIHSMINDLKTDTSKLSKNIAIYDRYIKMQDTLINTFPLLNNGFKDAFNRNLESITEYPPFVPTDATIQQLKYSGGFRILRNHNDIDSIMAYDATVKSVLLLELDLNKIFLTMLDLTAETFNFQSIWGLIEQGKSVEQLEIEKTDFLLTHDKITLAKYNNHLRFYNNIYKWVMKPKMEKVKIEATRLISYLEKEYQLN